MRRSLPFLLAGLIALVAQPALANQVVVRGSVPHHHRFFVRHHNHFFSATRLPIFFSSNPFLTTSPFVSTSHFLSANPFFDGGLFPTSSFGTFSGGVPVALGGGGEFADGTAAEPRIIVIGSPVGAQPPRRPEEERATVEETPSGVTIIRGVGARH
jgi:hypothetical protein